MKVTVQFRSQIDDVASKSVLLKVVVDNRHDVAGTLLALIYNSYSQPTHTRGSMVVAARACPVSSMISTETNGYIYILILVYSSRSETTGNYANIVLPSAHAIQTNLSITSFR